MTQEPLSFAPWLKQRRRILDLTQQELANRAACSLSTLRKLEAGDLLPSKELARLLAVALEVPSADQEAFIAFARDERRAILNPALMKATTAVDARPAPMQRRALPAEQHDSRPTSAELRKRLPAQLTPFIGRETEVTTVLAQLADPDCRLLTIVGPGGMGKTRLVLAVGHLLAGEPFPTGQSGAIAAQRTPPHNFPDGVYFAPFVGVAAPEFMLSTLASAIGFSFAGVGDAKEQLFAYLADKQLLLILDNLEHLLDGIEMLIELLQRAPAVKLLATSRQRLHLIAEWVVTLEGLPVPSAESLTLSDRSRVSSSAATLFLLHARRVKANFDPAGEEAPIAAICRLVGGMPLALEMAAAWLRLLPCRQIAQKIGEDLAFLRQPGQLPADRHRSIHAVFDYSWQLLSPVEQELLAQLAVFRGGFSADAAIAISGATLLTLAALIDHSLVRQVDEARYDMHELVRQYAEEKLYLDPEQYHTARERHCRFFAKVIATNEEALTLGQRPAIATVRVEVDNVRAAWRWAVHEHNGEVLAAMLLGLLFFYNEQSWFSEGIELFNGSLGIWETHVDQSQDARLVQARLTLCRSFLRIIQGDYQADRAITDAHLLLLEEMGDHRALALCLFLRGIAATHNGELPRTKPFLLRSLEESQAADFLYGMGAAQIALGDLARAFGEAATAEQQYRAVLRLARRHASTRGISLSLTRLGALAKDRGDLTAAAHLFQEGLAAAQPDDPQNGDLWPAAENLWRQAEVALELGDPVMARAGVKAALQRATQLQNNLPAILAAITVAGQIYLYDEEIEKAVSYLAYTQAQPSTSRENRMMAEQLLARAALDLTPTAFALAQSQGASRSLYATVEELLSAL